MRRFSDGLPRRFEGTTDHPRWWRDLSVRLRRFLETLTQPRIGSCEGGSYAPNVATCATLLLVMAGLLRVYLARLPATRTIPLFLVVLVCPPSMRGASIP